MSKLSLREILRFLKFLAVSVSAGVVQIGSFALLNEVFHWNYWLCYIPSLVLSVVWNLTVNRKVTFRSVTNYPLALLKTLAFYAVFTPVSTLLGEWLTGSLGWNEYVVTLLNMVLNFITEFLFQRFVVFGNSVDSAQE